LVLILALAGACLSWLFLPANTAVAVTIVAVTAAAISINFRR
jgi:uncharacterized membrane protein